MPRVAMQVDPRMTQGGSAPPSQQPQLMQAPAQPVKPRGAFGRQNPSFWQWLTLGPEAPDVLQQRRMRDMQMSALEQQQKLQSQGQTDLNSAIGQLPPEMQPFARVAPEAAIGAMFRQERAPPEPHYDSTTGNFWGVDPRTGEPRIMGRMPGWRPTQGAGGDRAPPSGYEWNPEHTALQPIQGGPADRPQPVPQLRGTEGALMTRTREAAEGARGLRALVQEFRSHLQGTRDNGLRGTFPGAGVQVWDSDIGAMNALQARMTGLMRPSGSGATSDFEQRLYARGAPNVNNMPEVNEEIIRNIETLSDIADARQFFYEDYASQNGTLNGAERAFQQSPEFQQLTGGRGGGRTTQAPAPRQGGQGQTLRYNPATGEFH